jgi:hypothetical protein
MNAKAQLLLLRKCEMLFTYGSVMLGPEQMILREFCVQGSPLFPFLLVSCEGDTKATNRFVRALTPWQKIERNKVYERFVPKFGHLLWPTTQVPLPIQLSKVKQGGNNFLLKT